MVAAARERLDAAGVVVVPTDTVYGLAAALDRPAGVARLYAVKGRLREQPCQVLLLADALLAQVLDGLGDPIATVADRLLPGATTCIVPDPAGRFAAASGAETGSVGLRAPRVGPGLAAIDFPLVATSANPPGEGDPARLEDVFPPLRAEADGEIDAGRLPGVASTVVDLRPLAVGRAARIVRPGLDPEDVIGRIHACGVAVEG